MGLSRAPHISSSDWISIQAPGVDQVVRKRAQTDQALPDGCRRERTRLDRLACPRPEAKGAKIGNEAVHGLRVEAHALKRTCKCDQVFYSPAVCEERVAAQAAHVELREETARNGISCAAREPNGPPRRRRRRQLPRSACPTCAVKRRRFSSGCKAHPASLQPEATGAGMEVTKCLKPPDSGHESGDRASVQAAT